MKKMKSAEWLAAVAIVTSATVLQIREHMQVQQAPDASASAAQSTCEIRHEGLVLAGCEATREEAPADHDRATRHLREVSKIWV